MRNLMFICILGAIMFVAAAPALERKAEQMVNHAVAIGSRGYFEEGIKELDRVDRFLGWTEAAQRVDGERAHLEQQLEYVVRADRHQEQATETKIQEYRNADEGSAGGELGLLGDVEARFDGSGDSSDWGAQFETNLEFEHRKNKEVKCADPSDVHCAALLDDLGFEEFQRTGSVDN